VRHLGADRRRAAESRRLLFARPEAPDPARARQGAGLDIKQALDMPRWLSGRFALGEPRDTLHIEARYPRATIDELARRGHILDRWGDYNELAGHANGITIDPQSGALSGGADPRSDGAASGC
jgi:gamma-glutamyltranspeptidase/glutathione hydrolase